MKTFILIFLSPICFGQNLVLNGDFEKYHKEINGLHELNAIGWVVPSKGTSDYFNSETKVKDFSTPKNYFGQSIPHSGKGYYGFGAFIKDKHIEYIQSKLSEPLLPKKLYCVEFFVAKASKYRFSHNELSLLFSNEVVIMNHSDFYDQSIIENNDYVICVVSSEINDWQKISILYTPKKNINYITIGFNKPTNINNLPVQTRTIGSYYYIDDVSLVEVKDSSECKCTQQKPVIKNIEVKNDSIKNYNKYDEAKDKPLVLSNIVFESNKANLLPISNKELNQLVDYLKQNNPYKIELSGYTDKTGKEIDNIKLSEARAKAVADFLIKAGVNEKRIIYKGFGSLNPKMPNTTEENKQINRRVEFTLKK